MSLSQLELDLPYLPKPRQSEFHQSPAKFRLYIGAWRAGKTLAGCIEALKKSILYPGNFGLIGRKNFTDLRDTTIQTFLSICPEGLIKSYNKTEHRIELVNGSVVLFRELKDRMGMGSLELGWFYIDEAEQVTEDIFEYLKGRLSKKDVGQVSGWLTSNPPNEDHWLYQQFEKRKDDPNYFTIHASTYENAEHLPDGYIAELEKLPLSWRKKYLFGEYGFTPDGKPYYDGFLESMHKRKLQHSKDRIITRAWDYGYHHPAVTFHQIDAKGRWLILAEHMGTNTTIEKFGNYVKILCHELFPGCEFDDVGDPAGEQVSDKSEKTSVQILASLGIYVGSRASTYRERKEIIERKLTTLIDGLPSLMVDSSCKTVIDGFLGGYHYPERKPGQAFNPQLFEVPFRDGFYEHVMNSAEYFAVNQYTGAETKESLGEPQVKVVGPFKDVSIDDDDEESTYSRYRNRVKPAMVEGDD